MMVAQQNAKGGVLGRPLEAVVVDSAAKWPLFAAEITDPDPRRGDEQASRDPAPPPIWRRCAMRPPKPCPGLPPGATGWKSCW